LTTKHRAQAKWRSLSSADFPAALAAPVLAKTSHFVVHHLAANPISRSRLPQGYFVQGISTALAPKMAASVDNNAATMHWWLGVVVPKRYAKRAVTRNLLKRQMRAQAQGHRHQLPAGQWLIRLRAAFDARQYSSAASGRLWEAARGELAQAFAGVLKR
jgi:ribonuclease P protein component